MRECEFGNLLKDAISRKHKKLLFATVYSHKSFLNWLQIILFAWEIHIPENSVSALSEWPAERSLKIVKNWLKNEKVEDYVDLINGACCEPLAYHLSSKMSQNHWSIGFGKEYKVIKDQLEE